MSSYIFCIVFQCMKTSEIKEAVVRMENKRNELEMVLQQLNELWLHLYSECAL